MKEQCSERTSSPFIIFWVYTNHHPFQVGDLPGRPKLHMRGSSYSGQHSLLAGRRQEMQKAIPPLLIVTIKIAPVWKCETVLPWCALWTCKPYQTLKHEHFFPSSAPPSCWASRHDPGVFLPAAFQFSSQSLITPFLFKTLTFSLIYAKILWLCHSANR